LRIWTWKSLPYLSPISWLPIIETLLQIEFRC
jgi:hypothetical protein